MKKFKRIYIEITNTCNLDCNFCPKTTRALSFMKPEDFSYIIKEISPFTDYIYLHLLGEPLLHPELEAILNISYENNIKVNITTNGTLINKLQNLLLSSKAIRQINYSLHSFESNGYKDSLENYINDILDFIMLSKEKTSIINALRLWNLPGVSKDIEDSNDAYNKENLKIYSLIAERFNISDNLKQELLRENGIKLMDKVYLNLSHRFDWPDKNISALSDNGFCYGLRDHIGILVDGTVVPCCLDNEGTIALGNIFKEPLQKISQSEKALNIYDGFSKREVVEELCKRCGYRHRFNE
jgi:radical SAM protein with 4Fe4S-binding SPASM domain